MLSNKRLSLSLRRTAFLGMILVLLTIFFTQFAVAENANISISGITFNAGGEPQSGVEIYIDTNSDLKLNSTELHTTSENGTYNFTEIPRDGFVRVLLAKSQTSDPREYDLRNLMTGSENKLNFSIGEQTVPLTAAAGQAAAGKSGDSNQNHLFWILVAAFLIISAIGCYFFFFGLRELNSLAKKDPIMGQEDKRTRNTMLIVQIASGFILLLVGMLLLFSLEQMPGNATNGANLGIIGSFPIIWPVVLTLLLFGAVLLMLYVHAKLKDPNEVGGMRRTIAGLLVVGLIAVVLFSLSGKIEPGNQNIITQYIQLVGIVIAFYFGSKATSDAYKGADDEGKAQDDLEVKKVTYDPLNKEIRIKASNNKGRAFGVNTVKIEDEKAIFANGPAVASGSESFKDIDIKLKLTDDQNKNFDKIDTNKDYNITIETTPIGSKSCKSKIEIAAADKAAVPPVVPPADKEDEGT